MQKENNGLITNNSYVCIIPETDKPIKLVNGGCEICKQIEKKLNNKKVRKNELTIYQCNHCGNSFCV